jgi:flagellar basal-body rod modification protein FlgD
MNISALSPLSATSTTGTDPTNTTDTTDTSSSSTSGTDPLANETTFLQLLVAQLQNQDPMNPSDSTAFLTQLAQFTQVEQLVGIKQDTDTLAAQAGSQTTTQPSGTTAP